MYNRRTTATILEEQLPLDFSKRPHYDLLVYYDDNSSTPPDENKDAVLLNNLMNAIFYQIGETEYACKRRPAMLKGGWREWYHFAPEMCTQSLGRGGSNGGFGSNKTLISSIPSTLPPPAQPRSTIVRTAYPPNHSSIPIAPTRSANSLQPSTSHNSQLSTLSSDSSTGPNSPLGQRRASMLSNKDHGFNQFASQPIKKDEFRYPVIETSKQTLISLTKLNQIMLMILRNYTNTRPQISAISNTTPQTDESPPDKSHSDFF